MAADRRRVSEFPVDVDIDPSVRLAARELRAGLVRVHPSFRFEERLVHRLGSPWPDLATPLRRLFHRKEIDAR